MPGTGAKTMPINARSPGNLIPVGMIEPSRMHDEFSANPVVRDIVVSRFDRSTGEWKTPPAAQPHARESNA
jgi:hypothetical protein